MCLSMVRASTETLSLTNHLEYFAPDERRVSVKDVDKPQ
jgi:hypothetical protein